MPSHDDGRFTGYQPADGWWVTLAKFSSPGTQSQPVIAWAFTSTGEAAAVVLAPDSKRTVALMEGYDYSSWDIKEFKLTWRPR